jgi:hypothetical protein
MKRLSFVIIFLLFIQFCLAQTAKNSLSRQNLKGRIKKIESALYNLTSDSVKLDTLVPHDKFIDLYDEKGNEVEDSYFGKDGILVSKSIKKYNEKNENIEEDYFTKGVVLESTTIYKYDEKGNLIESDHEFIPDKAYSKTLYKYDDKSNYIEDDIYNNDGSLRYKDTYKYDSNGNRTELNYWHAKEDTIRVRWTFSYNEYGNLVREGRYSPGGELEIENVFTYDNIDKAGNWQMKTRKSKGQNKKYATLSSYSVTTRRIYYY